MSIARPANASNPMIITAVVLATKPLLPDWLFLLLMAVLTILRTPPRRQPLRPQPDSAREGCGRNSSILCCQSPYIRARPICRDFGCSDTVDTMGICSLILRELHVSPLGKPGSERHFSSSTGDGKNYNSTFSHKPATACCQHCSAIGLLSL